jgi:hypothetical protein
MKKLLGLIAITACLLFLAGSVEAYRGGHGYRGSSVGYRGHVGYHGSYRGHIGYHGYRGGVAHYGAYRGYRGTAYRGYRVAPRGYYSSRYGRWIYPSIGAGIVVGTVIIRNGIPCTWNGYEWECDTDY